MRKRRIGRRKKREQRKVMKNVKKYYQFTKMRRRGMMIYVDDAVNTEAHTALTAKLLSH